MPPRTANLWRCHASYRATSDGTGGRGPTRLISPRNTFQSCGSSSRLMRRSRRPTRVTRGSLRILKIGPSASFSAATSTLRASASATIVRNLRKVNRCPFLPHRACRNRGSAAVYAYGQRDQCQHWCDQDEQTGGCDEVQGALGGALPAIPCRRQLILTKAQLTDQALVTHLVRYNGHRIPP